MLIFLLLTIAAATVSLRYMQCHVPEVIHSEMSDEWYRHTRMQLFKPGVVIRGQAEPDPLGTGVVRRG